MNRFLPITFLLLLAPGLHGQTSPGSLLWKYLTEGFMSDPYKRLDAGRLDSIQQAMNIIRHTDSLSDALAVGYYLLANDFILKRDVQAADTCLEKGIEAAIAPGVKGALYQMDEQLASMLLLDATRSNASGEQAVRYYEKAGERVQALTTYFNMVFTSLQFNLCSRGMQQLRRARSYYTSVEAQLSPGEVKYYEKNLVPYQQFLKARCWVCLGDSLAIWENKTQAQKQYAKGREILETIDKKRLTPWERGIIYLNLATTKHGTEAPVQEVLAALDSAKIAFTIGKYDSLLSHLNGYRAYISVLNGVYADTTQFLNAQGQLLDKKITTLFTMVERSKLMESRALDRLYFLFLQKTKITEFLSEKTGKSAYLRQTYRDYRTIMDIAEIQRLVATEDEALYSISHRYAHVMRKSVKVLYELYEKAQNLASKEQYLEQMWGVVQKSKEYTLRQALRKNNLTAYSPEVRVVAREDSIYLAELRHLYQQYRLASGEKAKVQFKAYNSKKVYYEKWISSLILRGGQYKLHYQERYQDEYTSVKQTKAMLQPDQTLIEYFFLDRHRLLVFVFSNEISHMRHLMLDDSFYVQIQQLEAALINRGQFHLQSKHLYDYLIRPVKDKLQTKRLLICPDRVLTGLPFGVLTDTLSAVIVDYSSYSYLLDQYAIGYDYSALTHYKNINTPDRKYSYDLISFAPYWEAVSEERIATLRNDQQALARDTLNLSKREVEIIGRVRVARHPPFLGQEANLDSFYYYAPLARILHVSSHAIFDEKEPDHSFILFFPNGTQGASLSLKDVHNMKIPSEMVVLSACETLKGSWMEGEGLLSWGKAFSYAGALSVLASRWGAHEKTTTGIIEVFYKKLPDHSKDVALQMAVKVYKNKHPHYWANFTIIGNQSAIQKP